ncbi:nucleoside triphosphate pyrophosphohydrolase family protein [Gelria sp. Kuro-4]|uniref:nucleoside triphosphate pyrophosphohydrolase family protein n=1 Tax=Gelria sp. Kuro-4 TaxID=2796927 RepID=UPI00351D017B
MAERLKNYALGLIGETGELVDIIKKVLYHDHPVNKEKIREEAGDVLWYLTGILREFDIDLEGTMAFNIEKLKRRYPEGFDVERSRNREAPDDGW